MMEYVCLIVASLFPISILIFLCICIYIYFREAIRLEREERENMKVEGIVHFVEEDLRDLLRYKG